MITFRIGYCSNMTTVSRLSIIIRMDNKWYSQGYELNNSDKRSMETISGKMEKLIYLNAFSFSFTVSSNKSRSFKVIRSP